MLETLRNAFKIKDIRKRIIFTFLMLVVIRIGSQLPIPGVDSEVFANWFASQTADGMGFFDAVTGGSFLNLSIFALNITPYITSSIIMQLLTIAIPKLEEMRRDGEDGRKKIAEITRYLTVALALIEAIAMAIGFSRGGLPSHPAVFLHQILTFSGPDRRHHLPPPAPYPAGLPQKSLPDAAAVLSAPLPEPHSAAHLWWLPIPVPLVLPFLFVPEITSLHFSFSLFICYCRLTFPLTT